MNNRMSVRRLASAIAAVPCVLAAVDAVAAKPCPPGELWDMPESLPFDGHLQSVALVDMDDDGTLDLVVTGWYETTIGVRKGNGDGTFGAMVHHSGPVGSRDAQFADLDGDGDLDVVVPSSVDAGVSVYRNDGAGGLSEPAWLDVGEARSLEVGDFDGDGDPDVAVMVPYEDVVRMLLNDGTGTLLPGGDTPLPARPWNGDVADIDDDGDLDLVVPVTHPVFGVCVLVNGGAGAFDVAAVVPVGGLPRTVAAGDLDGDGDVDLAVADYYDAMHQLLNDGNGTFVPHGPPVEFFSNPWTAEIADVDGEGSGEILSIGHLSTNLTVIGVDHGPGLGDVARYGVISQVPEGAVRGYDVAAGDLDHDGDLDLVAGTGRSTSRVAVLLNDGRGRFRAERRIKLPERATTLDVGDLDGDGATDAVVVRVNEETVDVLWGDGAGFFDERTELVPVAGSWPKIVSVRDLDGDGLDDALIGIGGVAERVVIAWGNRGRSLHPDLEVAVGRWPEDIVVDDLDGDGHLDFAVANWSSEDVSVVHGLGARQFTPESRHDIPGRVLSIDTFDWDADGLRDLVVSDQTVGGVHRLRNAGGRRFEPAELIERRVDVGHLAVADPDRDGDEDIVVARYSPYEGRVSMMPQPWNLGPTNDVELAPLPAVHLLVTDIDGDLDQDLVGGNEHLAVALNHGDGTFGPVTRYGSEWGSDAAVRADLDADGRWDLVTVGPDGTVSIWMGACRSCPPDLDGDGVIGMGDLTQLLAAWGPCAACPEELGGDAIVEFDDLQTLLSAWGACPE